MRDWGGKIVHSMFPEAATMHVHLFPLEFKERHLEENFLADYFRLSINRMRYATILGMVALALFIPSDVLYFPADKALILIGLRVIAGWGGFLALLALTFSRYAERYVQPALGALVVYVGGCVLAMIYVSGGDIGHSYYVGLLLCFMFGYMFMGTRFIWASVGGTALTALYLLASLLVFRQSASTQVISFAFVIVANLIGMITAFSTEYLARKEFFMRWQLEKEQQRTRRQNEFIEYQRQRQEAILLNNGDAVLLALPSGEITLANPAFYLMFGIERHHDTRRDLWAVVTAASSNDLRQMCDAVLSDGTRRQLDVRARREDGTEFDAWMVVSPVKDSAQRITGMVCSLRDIADRKRIVEQLHQAVARETQIAQMRARFIAMASHDLRNPLAVIQTANEMIMTYQDRLTDEQAEAKHKQIQDSVLQMTELLDDVLTVAQIEHGKLTYSPSSVEIIEFCQQIASDMAMAVGMGQRILFTTNEEKCVVEADPKLLRQIFNNLLSNAIKYSENGSPVYFTLRCEDDAIRIEVRDEGIGIPAADREKLFTTFFRASNVGAIPGTGLGLAIVQQSVRLHGGDIQVESVEQVGTTFTINLPKKKVAPA